MKLLRQTFLYIFKCFLLLLYILGIKCFFSFGLISLFTDGISISDVGKQKQKFEQLYKHEVFKKESDIQ